MATATIDPTTRKVPPFGGFNRTILGIEIKRMLRNRRTIFFTLVFPAGLFFAFGGTKGWNDDGRPRQRGGVHHGLDGAVRRRADRRVGRRDGRHGAGHGLVPPAPADPAQPGRLHRR